MSIRLPPKRPVRSRATVRPQQTPAAPRGCGEVPAEQPALSTVPAPSVDSVQAEERSSEGLCFLSVMSLSGAAQALET